ncbi:MAG: hypothetical protein KME35_07670 [Aphanocapsa sp. GSE-SYN-MK-11-07L]|nr:hypothetical protein [Aphanocapsa sp. GSE-SYN-MK-11-07L]
MEHFAVGTKNPRVAGYVSPELYKLVEKYLSESNISQSDFVSRAVTTFLVVGISPLALPESIRKKLESLAVESFRSPEDQARYLLQEAIENAWNQRNG